MQAVSIAVNWWVNASYLQIRSTDSKSLTSAVLQLPHEHLFICFDSPMIKNVRFSLWIVAHVSWSVYTLKGRASLWNNLECNVFCFEITSSDFMKIYDFERIPRNRMATVREWAYFAVIPSHFGPVRCSFRPFGTSSILTNSLVMYGGFILYQVWFSQWMYS